MIICSGCGEKFEEDIEPGVDFLCEECALVPMLDTCLTISDEEHE